MIPLKIFRLRRAGLGGGASLKIYPSKVFACGALDWGGGDTAQKFPLQKLPLSKNSSPNPSCLGTTIAAIM